MWLDHVLIRSPIDGHFGGCSYLVALVNHAAVNIYRQVSDGMYVISLR